MLASDLPGWGHWAESRARSLADRAPLWSSFLTCRVLESVGKLEAAEAEYANLSEGFAGFAPVWDNLVRLTRRAHRDPLHEDVLAARMARFQASGEGNYRDPRKLLLDRAAAAGSGGACSRRPEAVAPADGEADGPVRAAMEPAAREREDLEEDAAGFVQ